MRKTMLPLPLNAAEICADWPIKEGGMGVAASTDSAGLPYLGFYSLNWDKKPMGPPFCFQCDRLMARPVVGFYQNKPIVVFADAAITCEGVSLRLTLPPCLQGKGYQRLVDKAWGSDAPLYRMIFNPNADEER